MELMQQSGPVAVASCPISFFIKSPHLVNLRRHNLSSSDLFSSTQLPIHHQLGSFKMNTQIHGPVIGIPVTSVSYAAEHFQEEEPATVLESHDLCNDCKQDKIDSISNWIAKFRLKANYQVQGIKDHSGRFSHNLKGKLSSGTRYLRMGSNDSVFRKFFTVDEDEKLVESSKCYLSTSAGLIAGVLFISTDKIGFPSDKSIKLTFSYNKEVSRFRYKVVIPLTKIKTAVSIENSRALSRNTYK